MNAFGTVLDDASHEIRDEIAAHWGVAKTLKAFVGICDGWRKRMAKLEADRGRREVEEGGRRRPRRPAHPKDL